MPMVCATIAEPGLELETLVVTSMDHPKLPVKISTAIPSPVFVSIFVLSISTALTHATLDVRLREDVV